MTSQRTIALLLIVLLLLFNLYDSIATKEALLAGVEEANPVVRWIVSNWGEEGLWAVKLGFIGLFLLCLEHIRGIYLVMLACITSFYALLSIYHYLGAV